MQKIVLLAAISLFLPSGNGHCTSGFMNVDALVNKANPLRNATNKLDVNELILFADLSFQCSGNITSLILGVEVSRANIFSRYPEFQLWQNTENNSFIKKTTREIILSPDDFNTDGVFRFPLEPPIAYETGDIIGIYQPNTAAVTVYSTPLDSPMLAFNSTGNAINMVDLQSFMTINETLVIYPVTDTPFCLDGFLDMSTVLDISQDTQPTIFNGGFQRIFPNIYFTCNGVVTKWTVGAELIGSSGGDGLPELQIWRLNGSNFNKIGSSFLPFNVSINTNVHVYYPNPQIHVQPGDVLGLYTPRDDNAQLTILYQSFNGPNNLLDPSFLPDHPGPLSLSVFSVLVGTNHYPLVSVIVSASLSSIPTTSCSLIACPTCQPCPTLPPLSSTASFAIIGGLSGVIFILIVFVIILIIMACIVYHKQRKAHQNHRPQESLRNNPLYNTNREVRELYDSTITSNYPPTNGEDDNDTYDHVRDRPSVLIEGNPSYIRVENNTQ